MADMVNHPKHYAGEGAPCECIDVIHYIVKDLPPEVAVGIGNLQKYIWRLGKKSPDAEKGQSLDEKILEDLKKSAWYLNDAIGQMEAVISNRDHKAS